MIRPYQNKDQAILLEIIDLNTPPFFDPKEKTDLKEYLEECGDTYFVIEKEGKVVGGGGYCLLDDATSAEISWTLFHPGHSRQGLGTQIVEHCLNLLMKNEKIERVIVETSQWANKFFEKLGFCLTHVKKNYWGKDLDLYWMEKKMKTNN